MQLKNKQNLKYNILRKRLAAKQWNSLDGVVNGEGEMKNE